MPEGHPNYCWIHRVVERQGKIRCGECFHWFADEQALVSDYNDCMLRCDLPQVEALKADEIFFCPHCSHDF